MKFPSRLLALGVAALVSTGSQTSAAEKVKVYLLAGQSNMEGYGQIRSLERLGEHPEHGHLLKKLKGADGSWATRNDVSISWNEARREAKAGPLTVGWGGGEELVGPELMFGTIVGEMHAAPVLLIKTAWGGKDVFCDFRSPSAGKMTFEEEAMIERARKDGHVREVGKYYRLMVSEIQASLAKIDELVPGYEGQGYELCGLAWFQGWNDFCEWHVQIDGKKIGPGLIERYPHNLDAMIDDLRRDLKAPNLPVAIGELGVGGLDLAEEAKRLPEHEAHFLLEFRKKQREAASDPRVVNVTFVPTAQFWDRRMQELCKSSEKWWQEKQKKGIEDTEQNHLPTRELNDEFLSRGGGWYCHYNGSAPNYALVGWALAEALSR